MGWIYLLNGIIGFIFWITFTAIVKNILEIRIIKQNKDEPYTNFKILEKIINTEILFLILFFNSTAFLFTNKDVLSVSDYVIDILINIGCSIVTTIALSVFIYFKFLKHIPDENRKQIDKLLNERLGYETTNHNAVIQKGDSVQKSLSDEHSEIREYLVTSNNKLSDLSHKFDSEKELKTLQYNCLNDNHKSIIENINKISSLGEALQNVNYENRNLKVELTDKDLKIKSLEAEVKVVREENELLKAAQAPTKSHDNVTQDLSI